MLGAMTVLFLAVVGLFYANQEKILFHPRKLSADHVFEFQEPFEEVFIAADDDTRLHGLLFKAASPKGLAFYLHGNAGSLDSWGGAAKPFLANDYDCFILDYRGYGKSEGEISSEDQLLADVNAAYRYLTRRYSEGSVVVVGYSIGAAPAAYLAAENNPGKLILKAPYNNMAYLQRMYYAWLPAFGLRYELTTDEYLKRAHLPVTIFHGSDDRVIPYECSLKLQETFDGDDRLVTLEGQGHDGMSGNDAYARTLAGILAAD
ncbi:MAG: alpha/beta fold hydrolase [Candidatus Krumholzibacteriota bacterium]